MDDGKGTFQVLKSQDELNEKMDAIKAAMEEKYPNHGGWFKVGEEIELRGSRFRIKAVKPTELRLKLLPRSNK
jgi:hypothetical protein